MDPIRNLISGLDPLNTHSILPDGEEALRQMLSEPVAFSDTARVTVVSLAERRQRRARIAGIVTLTAAAVAAGVLVATNLGPLTSAPSPANTATAYASATPTSTASPTSGASVTSSATPSTPAPPPPTPPETPVAVVPAAWGRYANPAARLSFDIPPGWSVVEKEVDGITPGVQLDIVNDAGARMAGLEYSHGGRGEPAVPNRFPSSPWILRPSTCPTKFSMVTTRLNSATGCWTAPESARAWWAPLV